VTVPRAIAAWTALDPNVQKFIAETAEGRSLPEAVAILKEELPEQIADMVLAEYVKSLPMDRKAELIQEARKRMKE
jgi:uncharacterized protein HemY